VRPACQKSKLKALEALRGLAALYVFVHHLHFSPNKGIGSLLYFGQEAVVLFFLLSGFVIHLSVSGKGGSSASSYIRSRARRIFPVFMVALLISYFSACIIAEKVLPIRPVELTGNLLMLQDAKNLKPGVLFQPYYGNSPLWSLSYEWWFYIAFVPLFLWRVVKESHQLPLAVGFSVFGFLTFQFLNNPFSLYLSYLAIWWAGVEVSKEFVASDAVSFRGQARVLGGLGLMSVLWGAVAWNSYYSGDELSLGVYPVLPVRHYMAAVVVVLVGLVWNRFSFIGFSRSIGMFSCIAPVSYFLYVAHQPIINVVTHWLAGVPLLVIGAVSLVLTVSLGWIIEVGLFGKRALRAERGETQRVSRTFAAGN
jgi:peptidoglycan/LPS O-acetylase OafA/YrhL